MTRDERKRRDEQIVKAYNRPGASLHTVAKQFGLTHSRVHVIVTRAGVERKAKGQSFNERFFPLRQRVVELDRKGAEPLEIAENLGLSVAAVYSYLRAEAIRGRVDLASIDVQDATETVVESSRYCCVCGRRLRVHEKAILISWAPKGAMMKGWRVRWLHPTCWEARCQP